MKFYLILLAVSCFCFAACKKDRTCSCTVTTKGTSTTTGKVSLELFPGFATPLADTSFTSPIGEVQKIDKKMTKVSKRRAKNNCVSYSEPFRETIPTSVPASSFNLSVIVVSEGERTYKCELK